MNVNLLKLYSKYIICLFIFIYLAGRYGYGNDYFTYMQTFDGVRSVGFDQAVSINDRMESGWLILNAIFPSSNFNYFVVFVSFVQVIAVYFLLQKSELKKYSLAASFIYIFAPLNMLTLLSAMRQSIALTIFVVSLNFVINKKVFHFAATIFLASYFHSSIFFLLPIYFIYNNISKINIKVITTLISILVVSMFSLSGPINAYVNSLIAATSALEKYAVYDEVGSISSGATLIFYGVLAIFLSHAYNLEKRYRKLFILLAIAGSITAIASAGLIILYRISLYFSIFFIVAIPIAANAIKKLSLRYGFLSIYICYIVYIYITAFSTKNWQEGFGVYKTYF